MNNLIILELARLDAVDLWRELNEIKYDHCGACKDCPLCWMLVEISEQLGDEANESS